MSGSPGSDQMKVAIQTLGTRGDVQPYLALARELMRNGHTVQIAAPEQFEDLVRAHDVRFAPLPGKFLELLDTPQGKAAVAGANGFGAGLKLLKHVRPTMRQLLDEEWRGVEDFAPDIIVYHPKSIAAPHIAEKLSRPSILASPLPGFTPTSAFPSPLLPFRTLGVFNRASHSLALKGASLLFCKLINEWRHSTLALGPGRGIEPIRTLYAYSAHVVPKPVDWGDRIHVTGYWFLDADDWIMPAELSEFLRGGEPSIFIGFGSMPGLNPEPTTKLFVDALNRTRTRAVIATGNGALCRVPARSNVHFIESAPHDRIFPLVRGVVHHGGAGTTGAALRAGKPMLICPFFGDQPFWARRAEELGVAPLPLDRKKLTADAIARGVSALRDPILQTKASRVGDGVRADRGVELAVAIIEAIARTRSA